MTLGTWVKTAALVAVGMLGTARADEEKIPLAKVPATVKAAIKARFPGAEVKGASKETEGGETLFEISLTYRGDKYDVMVEPDGEIEAVERAILVEALPSAVVKAVKAKYPKAEIEKAEELTDEHGAVSYEVVVESGEKTVEVVLSPKGKIKEKEEGDEEDEKGDKDEEGEKHEKKADKGEKHEKKADKDDEHGKKAVKKADKHEKSGEDDERGEKHGKKAEKKGEKGEKHEKKADKDDEDDEHEAKGKSGKGEKHED